MPQPPQAEQLQAQFLPSRPVPRGRLPLAIVAGSLIWLVALVVVAYLVSRVDAVELALAIMAGSFVVGVLWSLWAHGARAREEHRG
jgi:hypothetical protein